MRKINWIIGLIVIMATVPVIVINAQQETEKPISVKPGTIEIQKGPTKIPVKRTSFARDLTVDISGCRQIVQGRAVDAVAPFFKVEASYKVKNIIVMDNVKVTTQLALQDEGVCKFPYANLFYDPLGREVSTSGTGTEPYYDGMPISGGVDTVELKAGEKKEVDLHKAGTISRFVPTGTRYLCVYIDSKDEVEETNERNNCSCCEVEILKSTAR